MVEVSPFVVCGLAIANLYGIHNTTTVTTAGMRCTGTNCETTFLVNIITKVMNLVKSCNTVS